MKMKKIISIAAVLAMSMTVLAACGSKEESTDNTPTEAPAAETTASEAVTTADLTPTEPVDITAGLTDKMYSRALISEGDRSRLAAAMKKAQNGEAVTVGVIGGSITQGTAASNNALCYASLFFGWWQEKFPECTINTVNAGIGGTNSYLGVSRADEQLLSAEPDVVVVEFSVNDSDKLMNKYSYDSLVRKILSYKSNPAVILMFTTQENGTSLQDVHREIGAAYDLPMLSYREAVYPEVAAGTLNWKDISPDNIHPNDIGHGYMGEILSRYLDSVYDDLGEIPDPQPFTAEGVTKDYYKDARLYYPSDIEAELNGFEVGTNTVYPDKFPENWVAENGGSMKFTADCRTMGVFFLKTVNGKGGSYEVYVDGERKKTFSSDFTGGWGNYGATEPVFLSLEAGTHEFEIKPAEGNEDKAMTILGIMLS